MDYNTSRRPLILPEYGRNVQKLVEHLMTIEDDKERNRMAGTIINIMGNMNPHLRDINDFKHKLWDHLIIMSNFQVDIDTPYPKPTKEILFTKPNPIPYNTNEITYRHFGRIIEQLIKKAIEFEDGDEKDALIEIIANHMKKSYLMWNKETVSDETIFEALKTLSDGKIDMLNEDLKLQHSREIFSKGKKKRSSKK